jgi:hypothetical protein
LIDHYKDNSNLYQAYKADIKSVRKVPILDQNTGYYNYDIIVQYQYVVDKVTYTGEYTHGNYPDHSVLAVTNEIMDKAKTPIDIFYEKEAPGKSVLTFAKNNFMLYGGLSIVFLIIGILCKFAPAPTYVSSSNYGPTYGPSYGPGYRRY